jgi:hypothetical protein
MKVTASRFNSILVVMDTLTNPSDHAGAPLKVYDDLLEKQQAAQTHDIGGVEMFLRSLVPGFEDGVAALAAANGVGRGRGRRDGAGAGAGEGGEGGVQGQLAALVEHMGLNQLVEMMTAPVEDDGRPLEQYVEPDVID